MSLRSEFMDHLMTQEPEELPTPPAPAPTYTSSGPADDGSGQYDHRIF